jgi:MerR family transcriptional regulator, global nitrogen regulator
LDMDEREIDTPDIYEDAELLKRLKVGIGEVAEVSGVPQRKLRYWEDKGIISPVEPGSSVRRYDYPTVKRILVIKELVDDGYTLDGAARKVDERLEKFNQAFGELGRSQNLGDEQ